MIFFVFFNNTNNIIPDSPLKVVTRKTGALTTIAPAKIIGLLAP